MSLPPIPQHLPGLLPHRSPHSKVSEKRASTQHPALGDFRGISISKEDLSNSWPSATLRRLKAIAGQHSDPVHPVRRFLEQVPKGMTRSYESVIQPPPRARREMPRDPPHPGKRQPLKQHTGQHERPAASPKPQQEAPFSLRLTPEAILVIQKRNLDKQRSANPRRIFASASGRCPRSCVQRSPPDVRELVKISLLNDQHRYDDMEYEEECFLRDADEGLLRKCTEWLQGVEMATGRGGNLHEKLQSLPHLNTF
ncbi:proline-rich protein 18 [Bufo gargarizans]|uniref:proline-rich protein 18 n=1 Tax=Bufo gargarizans TaxID=30331 RepID=UPI001CF24867|nr:proline-rich protein 18 [Bufo gargarizans]